MQTKKCSGALRELPVPRTLFSKSVRLVDGADEFRTGDSRLCVGNITLTIFFYRKKFSL